MKLKLLTLFLLVISYKSFSQDYYMRVIDIIDLPRSVFIVAVNEGNIKDTINYISFMDTVISEKGRNLNHFWGNYGNLMEIEIGKSYPFYSFKIPRVNTSLKLTYKDNNPIITVSRIKDPKLLGLANAFGRTLQWWNPIITHY